MFVCRCCFLWVMFSSAGHGCKKCYRYRRLWRRGSLEGASVPPCRTACPGTLDGARPSSSLTGASLEIADVRPDHGLCEPESTRRVNQASGSPTPRRRQAGKGKSVRSLAVRTGALQARVTPCRPWQGLAEQQGQGFDPSDLDLLETRNREIAVLAAVCLAAGWMTRWLMAKAAMTAMATATATATATAAMAGSAG